jgi:integrase
MRLLGSSLGPRSCNRHATRCKGLPFHTLLLLLYGTGMRIGEALSLTLGEVDLANRLLTITDSKFFKTRLANHRL